MKGKLAGYQVLPEVYDRWQQSYGKDFSSRIFPRLLRAIRQHGIRTSTLLDLACGTGTLALMMARRGWEVVGIDASEGMLREGMRKIRGSQLPVRFMQQDMRTFTLPARVSLATCMFDAVNHVTSAAALLQCFRSVQRALAGGGYFIFDVNNELCYKTVWRQTEVVHEPDFTTILQNSYDAPQRRAQCKVTLFLRRDGLFERKTETVIERYYPQDEIHQLLRRAGFYVLECVDFNFTPDPMVGDIKTWWVAQSQRE